MRRPDEVAELLFLYERLEKAQRRLIYKHKAHYSLNRNDGIENEALFLSLSAHEIFEQNMMLQALYAAIQDLTNMQLKRLYAHFFLDMTYAQIARLEYVDASSVRKSVNRALRQLRKRFDFF